MNTFPSPLQLLRDKRAGKIPAVTLPRGHSVRIGIYVASWRKLLTLSPQTSVANWDFEPVAAAEILHKISSGLHDRINRHLPWFEKAARWDYGKAPFHTRVWHKLCRQVERGFLKCDCRWCGGSIRYYLDHSVRFCSDSCKRDYYRQ